MTDADASRDGEGHDGEGHDGSGLSGDAEPTDITVSRAELIEASQIDATDDMAALADLGELAAPAQVLARAKVHLVTTVVRQGQIHRCDVWVAREGVVALPRQATDEDPAPLVAGRPVLSMQVVSSALDLDSAAEARALPLEAPEGLVGLVEQVVAGDADTSILNVIDWTSGEHEERWIVLDLPDGRAASLNAPLGLDDPLSMEPVSALGILQPLVARIAAACA